MKPKEFDELIRQKFDQNDFAYNPGNWDKMAEQLEGRAKKRSMIMWLWMPALGMAASVALAIGVSSMLKYGAPGDNGVNTEYTHVNTFAQQQPVQDLAAIVTQEPAVPVKQDEPVRKVNHSALAKPGQKEADHVIGISFNNAIRTQVVVQKPVDNVNLAVVPNSAAQKVAAKNKREGTVIAPGYHTFAKQEVADNKPAKLSFILLGGVNQGNHNSGYAAGATVRRMLNDKVYVESDVAFASSDNTQKTQYMSYDNASGSGGGGVTAAKGGTVAKMAKVESALAVPVVTPEGTVKTQDISYNLYYAQVTPSIGYKIMKKMSIGVGPDFQKMLVDNRPAVSTVDRGNIQVAPLFDVGFIGKTEYALTRKVKAAVSYRKGANGIINPSDKYIDRDYLQFMLKCTIFNK